MERNDELLLKLGWRHEEYDTSVVHDPAKHQSGKKTLWWIGPNSTAPVTPEARPRPYDNLQDAADCVPEGWEWMVGIKKRDGKGYGFAYLYRAGQSVQPIIKVRDCPAPAEALSEAIMKAVSHE